MRGWIIVAAGLAGLMPFASAAAPAAEVAPDQSLHAAAYTTHGLPPSDRSWSVDEFAVAAALLERVAAERPLRLPRLDSPRSGPVFRRLVDPANLEGIADPTGSLAERTARFGAYSGGLQRVMNAYAAAGDRTGRVFIDEQFAFQVCALRALLAGDALLAETLAALSPASPDHAGLLASRGEVRAALGQALLAAFRLLRVTRYSFPDRRLATMRDLQPLTPRVYPLVAPDAKAALKEQLAEMRDHEPDPLWRVCGSTLDALEALDDPARATRARTFGPRDAAAGIIRRSP